MKAFRLLLLGLMVATASGAEPAIEFSAALAAGNDTKVSLLDKTTGTSRWVKLGQEFSGYIVKSYDPATEMLVLTKGGAQFRLQLKSAAKVKAGANAGADPSPEIKRAILNNLRQLAAAADQFYLENGKMSTTLEELVGPTKYVKALVAADGENYGQIVFAQGKPLTVTTAGGYTATYAP